jgi:hypothetical protein
MQSGRLRSKRIYVSGPMPGLPGLNFPAFFKPAAAERDHQIPGTSGIRLNMLANEGE